MWNDALALGGLLIKIRTVVFFENETAEIILVKAETNDKNSKLVNIGNSQIPFFEFPSIVKHIFSVRYG